mmetsp:Transcript_22205/g.44499  ORF Transcript_22205/g.44499 Transcript_22205/m.44499 type:complete len:228 (+) Transcript_22205:330-1013(+)
MYTGCFYSGEQPDAGVFFYILKHFYPIVQRLLLLRGQIVDDDGERRIFGIETQFCQGPTRVFPRKTRVGGAPGVEIAAPEGHVVHFIPGTDVDGRRGVSLRRRAGSVPRRKDGARDGRGGVGEEARGDHPAHVASHLAEFFDPSLHFGSLVVGEGREAVEVGDVSGVQAVFREGDAALFSGKCFISPPLPIQLPTVTDVEDYEIDRHIHRIAVVVAERRGSRGLSFF